MAAFFRQYIAPLFIVLIFLVALAAVSARIFLPADMAAPAPVEETRPTAGQAQAVPLHLGTLQLAYLSHAN